MWMRSHLPARTRFPLPSCSLTLQALREGGVDGAVEGLAPKEGRLPLPECLNGDGGYMLQLDQSENASSDNGLCQSCSAVCAHRTSVAVDRLCFGHVRAP